MCKICLLLVCLASTGNARRVQLAKDMSSESADADSALVSPSEVLAALLLTPNRAFTPTSSRIPELNPARTASRQVPVRMEEGEGEGEEAAEGKSEETEEAAAELQVGAPFEGTIYSLQSDGYIVDIGSPVMAWLPKYHATDLVKKGDTISGWITDVSTEEERIGLTTSEAVKEAGLQFDDVEEGEEVEGTVLSLTPYGAILDIGKKRNAILDAIDIGGASEEEGGDGVFGQVDWNPDVSSMLRKGDKIKCKVKEVDRKTQQTKLSGVVTKTPEGEPEGKPASEFAVGDDVEGKILSLPPYGAIVDIGAKNTALLHISEIAEEFVPVIVEKLKEGDEVKAKVKTIDSQTGRIGLTMNEIKEEVEEAPEMDMRQELIDMGVL